MFRQLLVKFMQEKAKLLKEKAEIPEEMYFSHKDEKAIMSWREEEARKIFQIIAKHIEEEVKHLGTLTCPFCIRYYCKSEGRLTCEVCEYGWHHKPCSEANSDYKLILKTLFIKEKSIKAEDYEEILKKTIYPPQLKIGDIVLIDLDKTLGLNLQEMEVLEIKLASPTALTCICQSLKDNSLWKVDFKSDQELEAWIPKLIDRLD